MVGVCVMWCLVCVCFFFFKQKTAYEVRISDWSSDVCSSDLLLIGRDLRGHVALVTQEHHVFAGTVRENIALAAAHVATDEEVWACSPRARACSASSEIGRASCRARVCQ